MAIFKIYNLDFQLEAEGVSYEFNHVVELQIEDPERNQLTRGSNAKDKVGLAYKDGLREAKRWTLPVLDLTADLKALLDSLYDEQIRVTLSAVDRNDGSSKKAKNALLSNRPQQLSLDETADSMQVSLEFVTFDSTETHKS